jgi:hypothetical protein
MYEDMVTEATTQMDGGGQVGGIKYDVLESATREHGRRISGGQPNSARERTND